MILEIGKLVERQGRKALVSNRDTRMIDWLQQNFGLLQPFIV